MFNKGQSILITLKIRHNLKIIKNLALQTSVKVKNLLNIHNKTSSWNGQMILTNHQQIKLYFQNQKHYKYLVNLILNKAHHVAQIVAPDLTQK